MTYKVVKRITEQVPDVRSPKGMREYYTDEVLGRHLSHQEAIDLRNDTYAELGCQLGMNILIKETEQF